MIYDINEYRINNVANDILNVVKCIFDSARLVRAENYMAIEIELNHCWIMQSIDVAMNNIIKSNEVATSRESNIQKIVSNLSKSVVREVLNEKSDYI